MNGPARAGGTPALYAGFLLTGAATVILGPVRPLLEARFGLSPSTTSWLFLVQFASHALGAVVSTGNVRRSLRLGYALTAAGLAGLVLGWPLALGAVAVMGFGLGLAIPSTNILVAQRHPTRRAAALSHLNLLWGAGAITAPLLVAALRPLGAARLVPLLLGLAAAVVAAVVARTPAEATAAPAMTGTTRSVSMAVLAQLAAQMFLYTGAECAVGAWVISLAREHAPERSVLPELIGASFWLALLSGRAIAPLALQRATESVLQRVGLILAGAGVVVILSSRAPAGFFAGAMLCGFAFAPVFPILAAAVVAYTQAVRPAAAGPVFAIAGFGAGALPWLAGQLVAGRPSVRAALFVPAAAIVLMLLLQARERAAEAPLAPAEGA